MAAIIGALRAELSATVAKFREDMKNAGAAVREFATKAEAQGKRLQRVGAQLSVALTAPLVAFGVKAVQAATESAQALGQLDAALKSTEHQAGRTLKQLQAQAKALESISTFDDDDILKEVTTNLTKFGNVVGDVFDKAQLAIVNMASRTGDLAGATQTIGRALNDPIQGLNALTRAGVQFTNQEKEQIKALITAGRGIEAQALILEKLETAYGGAAKALRDATPTAALNQQWRELTEIIGGILVDILPPIIDLLRGIAEAFNALSPEMQRLTVYTGLFVAALGPLIGLIGTLMRAVAALTPILAGLRVVMLGLSVATWGWIAAIGAVVAALVIFWNAVKKILSGDFTGAWEEAKKTALAMWQDIQSMFTGKPVQVPVELAAPTGAGATIKPGTPKFNLPQETINARKTLENDIGQMGEKISAAFRKVELPKAVQSAADLNAQIDDMIEKAKQAGLSTAGWSKELQALRDRIESLKQVGLAKEAQEFGREVKENEIAVKRFAAGSLDPLNERLTTIDQAYEQLRLKIETAIEENEKLADVNDAAAESMRRLKAQLDALEGAHAAATEAAIAQWRAENQLADIRARRESIQTQEDLADLHRARGEGDFFSREDAAREQIARELEFRQIDAEERLAELQAQRQQAELAGDTAAVERLNGLIVLQKQLFDLISQTTVEQIRREERLQEAIGDFTDRVEADLTDMLKNWSFSLKGLGQAFKELLIDILVKPHVEAAAGALGDLVKGGIKSIGGSIGIPGFAEGGFVPPGQWAVAGERGPEPVFGGKTGLSVISHEDATRGGFGGNTTVIQNIRTQDVNSFQRTRRQLARDTKRALQET